MATDYTAHNPANWQIDDGMTVYARDGEKLGTVRRYDRQAGYLDVQRGWLFHKDFYVPLSAIQSAKGEGLTLQRVGGASILSNGGETVETSTGTGITLRLTKDDLEDERYALPPVAEAGVKEKNTRTSEWAMVHETKPSGEPENVHVETIGDGGFVE